MCEETEKQLKIFMNQWSDYCVDSCADGYHTLLGSLIDIEKNSQDLLGSAQAMLDRASMSNDRLKDAITNLEGQHNAVQRDVQDMHNRMLAERDKLQEDMKKLRSHYLSQTKSLVSVKGVQQPIKEQMLKAFGGIW
ncbi:hypothetical protein EON65_40735 [archaeon]|nr:MAG: hypothetical protein EON65_40735 [archaeon]